MVHKGYVHGRTGHLACGWREELWQLLVVLYIYILFIYIYSRMSIPPEIIKRLFSSCLPHLIMHPSAKPTEVAAKSSRGRAWITIPQIERNQQTKLAGCFCSSHIGPIHVQLLSREEKKTATMIILIVFLRTTACQEMLQVIVPAIGCGHLHIKSVTACS